MPHPADCVAVLTAAGFSSRMGSPKALLEWGDRPLLEHQLEALKGLKAVAVVVGHEAALIRQAVRMPQYGLWVDNPRYAEGRAGSIRAGIAALPEADSILVAGVDQPLGEETVAVLLAAFEASRWAYAQPTYEGRRGHPIVFSGRLRGELLAIAEQTQGLRELCLRHRDRSLEIPVADPGILLDLNTPASYASSRPPTSEARYNGRQAPISDAPTAPRDEPPNDSMLKGLK